MPENLPNFMQTINLQIKLAQQITVKLLKNREYLESIKKKMDSSSTKEQQY